MILPKSSKTLIFSIVCSTPWEVICYFHSEVYASFLSHHQCLLDGLTKVFYRNASSILSSYLFSFFQNCLSLPWFLHLSYFPFLLLSFSFLLLFFLFLPLLSFILPPSSLFFLSFLLLSGDAKCFCDHWYHSTLYFSPLCSI